MVINLLTVDGVDYVVSPRGNTQWARNVRAAGVVEVGPRWPASKRRQRGIQEVADAAKLEPLRAYLARWYWQVKDYVSRIDTGIRRRRAARRCAIHPGVRAREQVGDR